MAYLLLFLSSCMSALASVLIKRAGAQAMTWSWGNIAIAYLPMLMFGAALAAYCLGFLFYAAALRRLELTVAYPVMVGVTILLLYVYGLMAGENITLRSAAGALLLMLSIALIYSR